MTYEVQIERDTFIRFNKKPTTKELFRKMTEVGYFNTPQKVECMAQFCYRGSYKLAFNALYDLDKEGAQTLPWSLDESSNRGRVQRFQRVEF